MNIKEYIFHLLGKNVKRSADASEERCENEKRYTSPLFEKFALMSEDVLEVSPDPFAGNDGLGFDENDSNADRESDLKDGRWFR